MSDDLFDLARLRKAWAEEPAEGAGDHPKFGQVEAPPDPLADSAALLGQLRQLLLVELHAHRGALLPMLEEIAVGFRARFGGDETAVEDSLDETIERLEDLLEVYFFF